MPIKAVIERDQVNYLRMEDEMRVALFASATDVQRFLSTMPPKKRKMLGGPLPGGFYTSKQRRYVHAAAGRGEFEDPYIRSADLARSWTVAPGTDLSVMIFSDPSLAPYGRFVQDPFVRPQMHGDWPFVELAREKLEPGIMASLKDVARRYGFT